MKKIVQLITGTFLLSTFLIANVQAQTTMEEFMGKWNNSKQFTLDVLNKMPVASMDYKTDPAAMSFKEQIHHIGSAIVGISKGFLNGGAFEMELDLKTASKEELANYVAKCYDYGTATAKALTAEQAAEEIEVFGNRVTRRQVLALLMDHSTHHRGAAIAYLRASGVEPPAFVGF